MPFKDLLDRGVLSRIIILWVVSMVILWSVFAIGIVTHPQAWTDVQPVETQAGWNVFSFILSYILILLTLITLGNLFVRFGTVTPGLLILGIQIVTIGWTAGTNGFREPFPSVESANVAFLRIGLWEITAYISICAITLGKSLLVADTFPAEKWTKITRLKDLTFTRTEVIASILSVLALLSAAFIEAFFPPHIV